MIRRVLRRRRFCRSFPSFLLRASVLGDGLGTLRHGVLRELAGQQETNSSLNFAAGYRRTPVVVSETRSLGSNTLEDIVNKAVHDRHCLAADASVWMNLFQHLVDVDGIALSSSPLSLLVASTNGFRLAGSLLCSFTSWLRWHDFASKLEAQYIVKYEVRPVT